MDPDQTAAEVTFKAEDKADDNSCDWLFKQQTFVWKTN